MSRRLPNLSHTLALKAAAAVAAQDEPEGDATSDTDPAVAQPVEVEPEPAPRLGGRPRGRRAVAARQTVYLDEARHAALSRLADDRGRSVHSLILEGIDGVIGKPMQPGWR